MRRAARADDASMRTVLLGHARRPRRLHTSGWQQATGSTAAAVSIAFSQTIPCAPAPLSPALAPPAQRMKRERSVLVTMSPTCASTYAASIVTVSPACSHAENEISSITRSRIVCIRRAPMFSTSRLTCAASCAMRRSALSSKARLTASVCMRATCWRTSDVSGSVRMRYRSCSESCCSSTRMGSRPCSSASRSDGLHWWKAPEHTNRMWSVLMLPCFVLTVEPSISGSRSRCTPSDDASAEPRYSVREQILSISSMKTMPSCSTACTAAFFTSSSEIILSEKTSSSTGRDSAIVICRRSERRPPCCSNLSKRRMISFIGWLLPPGEEGSKPDCRRGSGTSTSMVRESSRPWRSRPRNESRFVVEFSPTSWSRIFSSTLIAISARFFSTSCARTIRMAWSTRSRMICSTSRPTKPTSVNLVASTLMNGAPISLASRLAISVLPTPVGPIMRMFLGVISSRSGGGTCSLRQRLRMATAVAFFASAWPIMYRSSCSTTSRGFKPWSARASAPPA
mmetsp:Transcript_7139/g.18278  ORF Transcript_7139/g.18278 Transcript_7139/m.18278 type:complete len:512 (-) Transcript_7139:230-1765(-)